MNQELQQEAGSAILWKGAQMAGSKIIFFVRLFVLARLLSPADFGLMAVAMVAIDVLMSLTNFGMIPALVQHEDAGSNHYHAAWTVGILRAVSITLIVFFGAPIIAVIVDEPQVEMLVRVLAFIPTVDALASMRLAELMRKLAFRELALVELAKTLFNTIISIALAPSLGVWALVAGSLAGSLAFTAVSYFLAPYRPRLTFDLSKIRPLIRYGRWIFLTSLVSVSGSAMLRVIISRELGAAALGIYFLAAKLAFLPTEVASEVIGAVAFPVYARLQTRLNQATPYFRANLIALSSMLVPIFALITVLAPALVAHILGERWQGTELIIQLLAIIGILGLVTDIVVPAFKGLGYPFKFALIEGAQSLLLVLFIYLFTPTFGLIGAPLAWFPAIFGSLLVAVFYLRRILPHPFAGLMRPMLVITIAGASGGVMAAFVYQSLPTFIGFILAGLLAVGMIAGLTWLFDQRFKLEIGRSLVTLFPQVFDFLQAQLQDEHGLSSLVWRQKRRLVRLIRRLLLRHLYRDDNRQLEACILVAGTARSGTTWLGDVVAGTNGRVLFEPFHVHKIPALHHLPYFPYLRPDEDDSRLHAYCHQVFSGVIRHPWVDREATQLRPSFRVIKEIRANLMLKWLQVHFPQVPQLLIVRHPCAVVHSRMQLQWATDSDLHAFLEQQSLLDDFLGPYLSVIEGAKTEAEKHAVIWCISHLVPLRQFEPEALNLVFYEDLCRYPERELARIERVIKRPLPPHTLTTMIQPSATTIASSAVLKGDNRVTQWQEKLSAAEIEQILTIVAAFHLDYLYGDSPWPLVSPLEEVSRDLS